MGCQGLNPGLATCRAHLPAVLSPNPSPLPSFSFYSFSLSLSLLTFLQMLGIIWGGSQEALKEFFEEPLRHKCVLLVLFLFYLKTVEYSQPNSRSVMVDRW